jgi:O-antigen/teichoic acid export membrane protein
MTPETGATQSSLSREAVRGTLWNYLSFASGKGLNFITTIILARLLAPEQFGLVAFCTIAIQYLDIMNTAGINSALIARRDRLEEAANAAFVANVIMGVVSFGLAWIAAPYIAQFFHAPEITDMFRILAVFLPINGLGLVPDSLLQRNLRFQTRLIPDLSRNITKGLTSIILAVMGFGAWSLIWGQIVGEVIPVIISWLLVDWRPGWKFDRQVTREVLTFGGHIIIVELVGALRNNIDYLIVGRMLGARNLGYYTMAYRIPELTIRSVNNVVGRVSLPILSRIQTDKEVLRGIYFGYIRYIALFTFPIGFGLALVSGLFIETLLSAEWAPAALPMALICVALTISSVGYVPGVLFKAINRPDILVYLSLVKLPIIISLALFCALGDRGGSCCAGHLCRNLRGYRQPRSKPDYRLSRGRNVAGTLTRRHLFSGDDCSRRFNPIKLCPARLDWAAAAAVSGRSGLYRRLEPG